MSTVCHFADIASRRSANDLSGYASVDMSEELGDALGRLGTWGVPWQGPDGSGSRWVQMGRPDELPSQGTFGRCFRCATVGSVAMSGLFPSFPRAL